MKVIKRKAKGVLSEILKDITPERLRKTKEKMERISFFKMLYWFAGEKDYEIDGEVFEDEPIYVDPKSFSAFGKDIIENASRQFLTKMFIEFLKTGKYENCIMKDEDFFHKLVGRAKYEWNKYNESK